MGSTLTWRKSARSSDNGGNCVEMARVPGSRRIATRDSKQPEGSHLEIDRSAWRRLIEDIKASRYDLT
jgi:hypothetical protein